MVAALHIAKLCDRIDGLRDTELKYLYIKMMGSIDEQGLHDLNTLFYDSDRADDLRTLRKRVKQYETAIQEAIENQQRVNFKTQQAAEIRKEMSGKNELKTRCFYVAHKRTNY